MKKTIGAAMAGLMAVATVAATPQPAEARGRGGAVLGAVIGGLALGAIIASSQRHYRPNYYGGYPRHYGYYRPRAYSGFYYAPRYRHW